MILKQLQLIGKAFLEEKSPINIYIERQKPYSSSNLSGKEADLIREKIEINGIYIILGVTFLNVTQGYPVIL